MGSLFGSPKAPPAPAPPAPAPPPPTMDQAVTSSRQADMLRQRKGAAASILAGSNPAAPQVGAGAKLLGQ
jgi:hypothetical protein